jgi:hypothetical protein
MALSETAQNSCAMRPDMSREETCEHYRELARAVVQMAWRDASPDSAVSPDVRLEAQEFLFSESAEFWAIIAGVHLAHLRQAVARLPIPSDDRVS